ncbi:hypothetical protein ACS0TY_026661 [Phlomoides rotata]
MGENVNVNPVVEDQANGEDVQRERTIRDFFEPPVQRFYDGIARPPIQANNFEVKPALLHILESKQFGGAEREDPHAHISRFLEYADTVKMNGAKGLPEDSADDGFINYVQEKSPEFLNTLRKIARHHKIKIQAPKKTTYFPPTLANSTWVDMHSVLQETMDIANHEGINIKDTVKFRELKNRIWSMYEIETKEQKAERKRKFRSQKS